MDKGSGGMQEGNYIKINRKILDWEWYGNINTKILFLHMLLKANWKDGKFEGTTVPRGSFISSYPRLSSECDLTVNEVRTAIKHLISTGEITVKAHAKYSVFTINNYCQYQDINSQIADKPQSDNTQLTDNAHSINSLLTTIEEGKKEKKEKNINNSMCKAEASALFESLWKLYPEKKGKGQVSDAAKKRLLDVGYEEMVRAIDRYKAEWEKDKEWRKPQNGSTFFNKGYVDYLDANYEPSKQKNGSKPGFNNFQQHDYDFDAIEKALTERS